MTSEFEMSDLGMLSFYLGLEVEQQKDSLLSNKQVMLRRYLLAHTGVQVSQPLTSLADHGSGESTTHQSCRPRLKWVDHSPVLPTTTNVVQPHTMARGRRREGEQSIHTQQKHQRWSELYRGDGKSELSIFTELQWQTIYTTLSI